MIALGADRQAGSITMTTCVSSTARAWKCQTKGGNRNIDSHLLPFIFYLNSGPSKPRLTFVNPHVVGCASAAFAIVFESLNLLGAVGIVGDPAIKKGDIE
jgi:hypothetical protein